MGKLYFLSVGCGNFTIIQSEYSTVLIDCGDDNQSGRRFQGLLPKNRWIDAVFITHQHFDHFRNLDYIKNNGYHVDWLIYSPYVRKTKDNSVSKEEWDTFLGYKGILEERGTKLHSPYRQENFDDPILELDEMRFFILGPYSHLVQDIHDASLVILAELGNLKCIFPGDASTRSLNRIAVNPHFPKVNILEASHHGSKNGVDQTFISKCDPDKIVISTSGFTRNQFPNPQAMKIYQSDPNRNIYRTDKDGGWDGYIEFDWE